MFGPEGFGLMVSAERGRGVCRPSLWWSATPCCPLGPWQWKSWCFCESFLRMAGQKGAVERWMQKTWVQVLSHTQLGDNLRQTHFASRF